MEAGQLYCSLKERILVFAQNRSIADLQIHHSLVSSQTAP